MTYIKFISYYVAKSNNMIAKLNLIDKRDDQINYSRMTRCKINVLSNYVKKLLTIENKDNTDMTIMSNFNISKPLFI